MEEIDQDTHFSGPPTKSELGRGLNEMTTTEGPHDQPRCITFVDSPKTRSIPPGTMRSVVPHPARMARERGAARCHVAPPLTSSHSVGDADHGHRR